LAIISPFRAPKTWAIAEGQSGSFVMVRASLLVLALIAAASSAQAQAQRRAIREQLFFISPSGEPFRVGVQDGPSPIEQWFNRADANHDGAIDHAEFVADATGFFARLDTDHDGAISMFENSFYERRVAPEITVGGPAPFGQSLPPPDPNTGRRPRNMRLPLDGAARFTFLNEPQQIRMCDRNPYDQRVTAAEWATCTENRFNALNTGHDGRLTLAGLPTLPNERTRR
jgi:hypothetical protein